MEKYRAFAIQFIISVGFLASVTPAFAAAVPSVKTECMDGGWQNLTDPQGFAYRGQGDCISYRVTGGQQKTR
jgi:hypothetical protein